jgi:CDP-diacylglycerol--serine O-phosphatidyltransferase
MTSAATAIHRSNLLTYGSVACGVGTIAAALQPSAAAAGALLALAALLDTFDGRFARHFTRTPEQQAIGGELDSLVDAVAFGIAPVAAIGILLSSPGPVPPWWWGAAILYVICALTRLAHFNVTSDDERFVGIPTPVAALVWSTVLLWGPDAARSSVAALALAAAMVSPLPVGRPGAGGLSVFASWPVVLMIAHAARL